MRAETKKFDISHGYRIIKFFSIFSKLSQFMIEFFEEDLFYGPGIAD